MKAERERESDAIYVGQNNEWQRGVDVMSCQWRVVMRRGEMISVKESVCVARTRDTKLKTGAKKALCPFLSNFPLRLSVRN